MLPRGYLFTIYHVPMGEITELLSRVGEITYVPIEEIKENPDNPNTHTEEQIKELCEQLKYQGWRHPLIGSARSGLLVAGHGRLEAARRIGITRVPVSIQSFESEDQELSFVVADNAIASWAKLDLSKVNLMIPKFDGATFHVERLAIKGFTPDATGKFDAEEHWTDLPEFNGPEAQFRFVVYVDDETKKDEFLRLVNASEVKTYKNTKVVSFHWPQK